MDIRLWGHRTLGQIYINLKEPELVSTGRMEVWGVVNHDAVKQVCEEPQEQMNS